jgi:hypothetical protein
MSILYRAKKTAILAAFLVVSFSAAGCSKPPPDADPEKAELNDLYDLYLTYLKQNQRPPKQLSDLNKPQYETISPGAIRGLREGKYVFVWGVNDKSSGTVLAYTKGAPAQGGPVLMADGTIKTMSADELTAALKAKN